MKKVLSQSIVLVSVWLFAAAFGLGAALSAATPVERWGQLKVQNAKLVAQDGSPVQLVGPSLFDLTSYGQYASAGAMARLRDDWGATVFRAALYTEYNGYFIGQEAAERGMYPAVDAAVATGLYVLVDWHILADGDPTKYQEQAKAFFDKVSQKYANVPNVIYEICNEPNGLNVDWAGKIKPYAQAIIPIIRKNAPNAIVLVGTPVWSSNPHLAAADPLPFDNVMYVVHYYAGSHDCAGTLGNVDRAAAAGGAVFNTEWGTTNANVSGRVFYANSIAWARGLAQRSVSWANWSLGTKVEPTSMLKPNADPNGNWALGDLTDSGLLVRALMRGDKRATLFADNFESANFRSAGWVREGAMLDRGQAVSGQAAVSFEEKAALSKLFPMEAAAKASLSFYAWGKLAAKDKLFVEYSLDGKEWKPLAGLGPAELKPAKPGAALRFDLPPACDGQAGFQFRLRSELKPGSIVRVDDVQLDADLQGL